MPLYSQDIEDELIRQLKNNSLNELDFSVYHLKAKEIQDLAKLSPTDGGWARVSLLPTGQLVFLFYTYFKIWDPSTKRFVGEFFGHEDAVLDVQMLTDNQLISASRDKTIKLWDLHSQKCFKTLKGHKKSVSDVIVLADELLFISVSAEEATIKLWNRHSGKCIQTNTNLSTICHIELKNGRVLTHCNNVFQIWDQQSGKCLQTHTRPTTFFNKDVAVLSTGEVIHTNNTETITLTDPISVAHKTFGKINTDKIWHRNIALLPDGNIVTSGRNLNEANSITTCIWDIKTGERLQEFKQASLEAVFPNGQIAVSIYDEGKKNLKVLDPATGNSSPILFQSEDFQILTVLSDETIIINSLLQKSQLGNFLGVVKIWDLTPPWRYADIAKVLATVSLPGNTLKALRLNGVVLGQAGFEAVLNLVQAHAFLEVLEVKNTDLTEEQQQKLQNVLQQKSIALSPLSTKLSSPSLFAPPLPPKPTINNPYAPSPTPVSSFQGYLPMSPVLPSATHGVVPQLPPKPSAQSLKVPSTPLLTPPPFPVSPVLPSVPQVFKPVIPQKPLVPSTPSLTPPPLPHSPSAGRLNDAWKIKHSDVQLEKQIGSGGCGVVYQGRWQGIKVAVKQLHGGLNKAALEEFQQEAQLAASLQHDHVVQLYGVTQEAPYYMVMKYMGKGSLYDVLRQEELSWEARVKFGLQVTRGLSFLHDKGIIHRDVKSMNVLVSKKDDIKLSDFGLSKVKQSARSVSKKSGADGSIGTLHWKAPELFKMGAKHTSASDIYSLGVLLWELSTGRLPYEEAEDESQIMAHVLGGNREELNPEAPAFLNDLIEQCWAQNPADRPSMTQVIEALKVGLSTLKGKPMSPQVSTDNLPPSTPPVLNSGDYRGAGGAQQQGPDSGNYLRHGQQTLVQSPVAPRQPGLFGVSQPLVALHSGGYRQAQGPVPNNNNHQNPEANQLRPQRKFG